MTRILIFRGGALGDFLLTLPAIMALRRRFPGAHIELAGYEKSASIALASGIIDRVQSLDSARMALYFQRSEKLPRGEQEYIRSFDLVISCLHDPGEILLKNLEDAGAKNIVAVSPIVSKCHAADHFYEAIKNVVGRKFAQTAPAKTCPHFIKCGHESAPPEEQFLLKWPQSLKEEARIRLVEYFDKKQVIIIHPGSGSPAKNWPAEKFAAFAKKISAETDYAPLIIGGEADEKAIAVMRPLLPEFHFLVNAPLADVASMLSVAAGFVGNDSGITHLAAALGIPVIALFGPTDPAIWAPRGKNVSVIKRGLPSKESLSEIEVETVFQALKASGD